MGTSPTRQRRNRQATEEAILQAFATVVVRDGLQAANPTTVMAEAGYSKPLLYDYFGDMRGLVQAWFDRNQLWPNYDFPASIDSDAALKQSLKRFLLSMADAIRANPILLEFLAAELNRSWEYQSILEASRNEWLQKNMADVMSHPEIREEDNWNLLFVAYNAINYLALRSRAGTAHVGLHLNEDDDWRDAMRRVESVIDDLIMVSKLRRTLAAD